MQRGFKSWCENIAIQQRANVGLKAVDPLDPWLVVKSKGILVHAADEIPGLDEQSLEILTVKDRDSWSAVTINGADQVLIIFNPSHSKERIHSDLMHELSHIIIGHKAARMDVSEDNMMLLSTYDKEQEDEANWLAGCLLLPREAIVHIHRMRISFDDVKTLYGVSKQMYDYRVRMTGVDRQLRRAFSRTR